ncbi:hypothetical protein [Nocardioides sp. P5_C9_2]
MRSVAAGVTVAVDQLDRLLQQLTTEAAVRSGHGGALSRIEHLQTVHVQGLHPRRDRGIEQSVQHILSNQYAALIDAGKPLPSFDAAEARFYSQNGEDGIIQLILAATGTDTKRTVEICAGDGVENNSANLIVNHGWTGLLVDGGDAILETGRNFYQHNSDTYYWPPTLLKAWITRDSVNQMVQEAGFAGDIDMLTIDIDGMDYWIWEALDCVNPRIVVTEYNAVWPADMARTLPYQDEWVWEKGSLYIGASLGAMVKLGKKKGYRLVGGNRLGFNAFFVREDLAADLLPEVDPRTLLTHPAVAATQAFVGEMSPERWVEV